MQSQKSHTLSNSAPLPRQMFWSLVNAGHFDEIPNYPGAVRDYIFNNALHDHKKKKPGPAEKSVMFCVYQYGRYGPQNGYRFCVVHRGYYVSKTKEDDVEDVIDRLEKDIPQGHEEMVILGEPIMHPDPEQGSDGN
jgi:hypothetical protein